jgi:hypothetical protein
MHGRPQGREGWPMSGACTHTHIHTHTHTQHPAKERACSRLQAIASPKAHYLLPLSCQCHHPKPKLYLQAEAMPPQPTHGPPGSLEKAPGSISILTLQVLCGGKLATLGLQFPLLEAARGQPCHPHPQCGHENRTKHNTNQVWGLCL